MSTRLRRGSRVGDVVVVVLLLAAAFYPHALEPSPHGVAVGVVTVATAVIVPWRRRALRVVSVAGLALLTTSTSLGEPTSGVVLGAAVILFEIAIRTSRRTTVIAAACAVGCVVVASLVESLLAGAISFDPRIVQSALTLAFGAAIGDATRSRRETIDSITERAERAEQSREAEANRRVALERLSIARDLHDAVAHQIAVISLNAGVATSVLETRPEAARDALITIRAASREVLREIGDLLQVLRSDDETSTPPSTAPQPGFDQLDALVQRFREVGLQVDLLRDGETRDLPGSIGIVAYRVIQEALTNAHKHGGHRRAEVSVVVTETTAMIAVENPMVDASAGHMTPLTTGHGITGMKERVASVRGTMSAAATAGVYRVEALLPIPQRTSA